MTTETYKVLKNDKVGRYAVATKSLEQGELILTELPFAVGPKPDTPPVCLGCYAPVDGTYLCSKCSWPMCGPECETVAAHSDAECKIFAAAGIKIQLIEDFTASCPQYECITPLRVLVARDTNPKRWENEVSLMESHNKVRKEKPIWNLNQVNVVNFLRERCKLSDKYNEELIHTVCGILEVNAFEARTIGGYNIRALYPQLAILSHNCVPNTTHSIVPGHTNDGEDFRVKVHALVKIESGAELFSSYTYVLAPTLVRREHLLESKYFECACKRCADPTELGTHLSSLKCNRCDPGLVMSTNPLDSEAIWKCSHCDFTTKGAAVRKVFSVIQSEIDEAEYYGASAEGIEKREQLVRKYKSILHPKHAYHSMLRQSLSQLYGRAEGYVLDDLPDLLLERKIEFCEKLLEVLNVIEPGNSRLRGMTLYELHAPVIYLSRNRFHSDELDETGFRNELNRAASFLEESAKILSIEAPNSPEGIIGQIALQAHQQLKDNMEMMIAMA